MTKWKTYNVNSRRLPKERKLCLVMIAPGDTSPASVAVGYLRFYHRPFSSLWVVPGFGRAFSVTHYTEDVLPEDLNPPLWPGFGGNWDARLVNTRTP